MAARRGSRRSAMSIGLLVPLAFVLGSCAVLEAQAGENEARATVVTYLEALGGAEPDRGWSVISERMRDGFTEEIYLRWASAAVGPPPITDIELTHEEDGLYVFTVSYRGPMNQAYSQSLFTGFGALKSPVACPNGSNSFEMAVIVREDRFAGITGNSCTDGGLIDPRNAAD